jgi:hypothetical protein
MPRRLFQPTARQTNWLLIVGFMSVGYAMYLRYTTLEVPAVALTCQAGLDTWLCLARRVVNEFFKYNVFGGVALGIAALNLLRPSIVLLSAGLAMAGLGLVLYNTMLSAYAVTLLALSLARPVVASD